jgi:hypothetical protein
VESARNARVKNRDSVAGALQYRSSTVWARKTVTGDGKTVTGDKTSVTSDGKTVTGDERRVTRKSQDHVEKYSIEKD